MAQTKIQWTDAVWNPVTGCTKVSQGCKNCYAERMAKRLAGRCGYPEAPHQFDVTLHHDKLNEPLRWKKPRRVFVNSMSDLFHKDVPNDYILRIFNIMNQSRRHTFQILTKRPGRMADFCSRLYAAFDGLLYCNDPMGYMPKLPAVLPNVWLGVSIEDQKSADERIPQLLQTPAIVRFLSCEPLLGSIDISGQTLDQVWINDIHDPLFDTDGTGIDWVIVGCESGPSARPTGTDWARSLRDQCQEAGVPFFLKQMKIDGKLIHLPELDGKVWDQFPGEETIA